MNRRQLSTVVLVLWVGGLGWLAARTALRASGPILDDAVLAVNPGAAYHALVIDSVQVGVRSWSVDTSVTELTTQDFFLVDVPNTGRLERTNVRVTAILTRGLELKSFRTEVTGDVERWAAHGVVESDSAVTITLFTGRDSTTTTIRVPGVVTLPSLIPITAMFRSEPTAGDTLEFDVVDPVLLTYRQARVAVGNDSTFVFPDSANFDSITNRWVTATLDTVQATRFDLIDGGLAYRLWVERSGSIAHIQFPSGAVGERQAFELAYENFRRAPTPIARSPLARLGVTFAREPTAGTGGSRRGIVLHGIEPARYADLGGGEVTIRGDTVLFEAGPDEGPRGRSVGPRLRANNRTEPLVQIDDPRVGALARQITKGARDRDAWPDRIAAWLRENVRFDPSATAQSALDVLAERRADANGLVTAFVALARSAGVPARVVTGILLQDDRFYFRSWAEVFDRTWTPAPVTFAPDVRGAYVRLSVGRWARPWQVIELIGPLHPEVL